MSQSIDGPSTVSSDDSLPPVEPPSAGFVVQLFFVPLVIVVVMVVVWLLVDRLTHMGRDPRKYIERIASDNAQSMQAAHDLATELQNDPRLRRDAAVARKLASLLKHELDSAEMDEEDLVLRVYLCKALGEFQVPDGLDVLLEAAVTERDEKEVVVRTAAIQSVALSIDNVRRGGQPADLERLREKATAVLLSTSAEEQPDLVRSSTAFALGVVGGDRAIERLEEMLHVAYPDARYNAATGLARHGDAKAQDVLVEMLDPQEMDAVAIEVPGRRDFKRATIIMNALAAAGQLAEANPDADLTPLRLAVRTLLEADVNLPVRLEAQKVLRELDQRTEAAVGP